VLALQVAAELAATFEPEMVAMWREQGDGLGQLCRVAFGRNGRYWDDLPRTTYSQLGAAMTLLTGVARPEETATLLDEITARSLNESNEFTMGEMVLATPFMHHYLFAVLRQNGRSQAILDIIKLRWGRWVRQGYPTAWENWNVDFPDGSQCHAFSAHPRYHLAQIFKQESNGRLCHAPAVVS
jgi:hypothetical protein